MGALRRRAHDCLGGVLLMPRIPLQFGTGLDRASGVMASDPGAQRDLRNVYLYRGKIEARKGHTSRTTITGADHIVGGQAIASEQVGIVVAMNDTSKLLSAYRVPGDGLSAEHVDDWFTLATSATADPPRIIMAESYGKAFAAHDEPRIGARASAAYYDPFSADLWQALTSDLDEDMTAEELKFRGLIEHLAYIVGWGYGDASEPNRPELLRISKPDDPLTFEPRHWLIVGRRWDPIIACSRLGSRARGQLLIHKETETYALQGYSRDTFGVGDPIDPLYGIAGSRLWTTFGGAVFVWSLEGPRIFDAAGPSRPIDWPLDLNAPAPSDLAAEGALQDGLARYIPNRRAIEFIFGQRVYTLHLWKGSGSPDWSYTELPWSPKSAFMLYGDGTALTAPPTGYPSFNSATYPAAGSATLTVDHNDSDGDETMEIWIRPTGGSWELAASVAVNGLAQQDVALTGKLTGTDYDYAGRYRRGAYYTSGYEDSSDPTQWATYVADAFLTTMDAPTLDSLTWQRNNNSEEEIGVQFTPAHADRDVVIKRGAVEVTTITAATHGGAQYTYHDTGITGEATNSYETFHRTADVDGPTASDSLWGGPVAPSALSVTPIGFCYNASWTNGNTSAETEIESKNIDLSEDWHLDHTELAGGSSESNICPTGWGATEEFDVRVRHKLTSFSVVDYSDYHNPAGTYTTEASP